MEVVLVHQTTKVRQDDYESKRSAKKSRFDWVKGDIFIIRI
jgi:hypothetical protein